VAEDLAKRDDIKNIEYINKFANIVEKFEYSNFDVTLPNFLKYIDLIIESGDMGAIDSNSDDPDTVKIMTVHSAKGLEFKYVFLVDLVERRFPSDARSEKIPVHQSLIKEKMAENDNFHIEEERRLFYVALTRAKEGLFLSSAKDFGGARDKRPSAFIKESGLELLEIEKIDFANLEFLKDMKVLVEEKPKLEKRDDYKLPAHFSFSQFAAFDNCPLQYKYMHILKIPSADDKPSLVFGRVVHDTLYNFMLPLLANNNLQADLFSKTKKVNPRDVLTEEKILAWYKKFWQDEGYGSEKKRDEYLKKGRELLLKFLQDLLNSELPNIYFLEKDFRFKFKDFFIKGKIDRIDKIGEGSFEIIDYKTGAAKEKLEAGEKKQLILYKMVAEASFGIKVDKLSYYYLEDGQKMSFAAKDKDIEGMEEWLLQSITEIQKKQFLPKPSPYTCPFCDFKGICEYRQ
jgi:DNA helicase-2/ATP-dependent DNA helicase PcrA